MHKPSEKRISFIVCVIGIIEIATAVVFLVKNNYSLSLINFLVGFFYLSWSSMLLLKRYDYLLWRGILSYCIVVSQILYLILKGQIWPLGEFLFNFSSFLIFLYIAHFHDFKYYKRFSQNQISDDGFHTFPFNPN